MIEHVNRNSDHPDFSPDVFRFMESVKGHLKYSHLTQLSLNRLYYRFT
jgi:hypothetical protein